MAERDLFEIIITNMKEFLQGEESKPAFCTVKSVARTRKKRVLTHPEEILKISL